jgi:hypothetical protein
MKHLLVFFLLFVLVSCEDAPEQTAKPSAQAIIKDSNIIKKEAANPYASVDVSPMDMIYFPTDFPIKKMNGEAAQLPVVRVIYSRPHRGGRELFGELVKWGQPWRLGANEATEIQFFKPVTIQNQQVEKGQYIVYAIPFEDHWTIILNKNLYSWGLNFNPADDVYKFDVSTVAQPRLVEQFTISFEPVFNGAHLIMAWENTEVRLPLQF